MLCHADGTTQRDPAAPGVRAGPDLEEGQLQAQEYEALLHIKVKPEAEIATYCSLLEEGEDFVLDALDNSHSLQTIPIPRLTGLWTAEWCLRSTTPKV